MEYLTILLILTFGVLLGIGIMMAIVKVGILNSSRIALVYEEPEIKRELTRKPTPTQIETTTAKRSS